MIETTSMSKTYKMPILLAFYNDGNIKMEITEDDIYNSFYNFYRKGSNKVDMLKDKGTSDFLFGLANNLGYSEEDLLNKRNEKLKSRGGFKEGIILKKVY